MVEIVPGKNINVIKRQASSQGIKAVSTQVVDRVPLVN